MMTEKQKKFLEIINKMMPKLTEREQDKLLSFGEGMAYMLRERDVQQPTERPSA